MHYAKNDGWLLAAWLLVCLLVTSCAATLQPSPPLVLEESVIPALSNELKTPPEPTGAYWSRVTEWRKNWETELNTLRGKYGP